MTVRKKVLLCFVCQQVCFMGGLAICIALRPQGLSTNDGISYYGIFPDTFPYYAVCLLGTAVFSAFAARFIMQQDLWPLRYGLLAFAVLAAVIAFTPYFISTLLDYIHTGAGIIQFTLQLAISFWLLFKLRWQPWAKFFFTLQVIAGVFSLMYVPANHGFLTQSQIVFQLAFFAILLQGFRKLLPEQEMQHAS